MPSSDVMDKLVRISSPVIAPLAPSQDTTSDQLASFYRNTPLPFVRHSPLPVAGQSASGAAGKSVSQTTSISSIIGATRNQAQIAPSTLNQGTNQPIQKAISNLSAVSFQGGVVGTTSNPTISVTGGTSTYAVIPEMTLTATFKGNKVFISFTGAFDLNLGSSASASFAIFKDGVQLTTDYKLAPAYSIVEVPMYVSLTFIDTPSAASHTYDVRWQTHATGTVTQTAEGTARALQVVELG